MRVLGIDPGLILTGYGLLELRPAAQQPRLIDAGVIRLSAGAAISARLEELADEVAALIEELKPDMVAIETLYAHYAHPRTAILMGHARGVLLLAAQRAKLPIHEYAANRVKQAVAGHGHASKGQMQRAVQSIFGLKKPPEPPDVADAIAIALCCAQRLMSRRK